MANDWDSVDDFFTDEFTVDVTYSGYTLHGLVYMSTSNRLAVAAGLQSEYSQRVMVRVSDCEDASWTPAADDELTVDGTARRIMTVDKDSTGKCYLFELQETTPRG